jgi:hypothetical protein
MARVDVLRKHLFYQLLTAENGFVIATLPPPL